MTQPIYYDTVITRLRNMRKDAVRKLRAAYLTDDPEAAYREALGEVDTEIRALLRDMGSAP